MTKERFLNQLEKMKGNTYLYMGKLQKILYHIDSQNSDDVVFIVTDKTHHRVPVDKQAKYLNDFVGPVEDDEPGTLPAIQSKKATLPKEELAFVVDTDTITSLKETLLENIRLVKQSKEYIPQAFEINQQVKTLMNLAKTEIDLHRMNTK